MKFEHVTFDLPRGTFHALQGGDPDGQPTLVLHGFPDHPPTATPFLAELGRRGRHVVAPWLRGYAPSPTAGPFDIAALTGDVIALIDRWSPGRAVELVGHDWGGALTYDACVTAPDRIERGSRSHFPRPLARSSSPGGAARAPAGEHARALKILPGAAETRHAWVNPPPISADRDAPAAAPRCRRWLHPPPAGRRPTSVRRPAHTGSRPRRRSLPAHRSPRGDRGTLRGMGRLADQSSPTPCERDFVNG